MGFDEGQIVLDTPNGAYFPGQILRGRLEFDQEKEKTFRGIYVKVKGFCMVHWTSTHTRRVNDRDETYTVSHDSHEEYLHTKMYLIGGESGEYHLPPGRHVFPFECQIPPNCPSSFEGSHGHVRYEVKIVVDRAFKFDQEKIVPFRVIAPLDLNTRPNCKEPVEFEIVNTFCCWCISSGSCQTLVKLPAAGYCPGQNIPIEVSCQNNSNVEIDTLKFSLDKTTAFHAAHEPADRDETEEVRVIKKGPIPANTTRNWTVEMDVPAMDVYNLDGCRFIDIFHTFGVAVETPSCHTDEDQSCPIVIGSVPIVGFQDNILNLQNQIPNQPIVTQTVQTVTSSYPPPVSQPGAPYPGPTPYPQGSPYPNNTGYPGSNPPYPGGNQPYPASPYPGGNSPYPGGNSPYPGGNGPYPAPPGGSPYPPPAGVTPYQPRSPYPGSNNQGGSPYPPTSSPYPAQQSVQYQNNAVNDVPTATTPLLKTGTMGFVPQTPGNNVQVPALPPGANVPYPPSPMNPYVGASAPVPSTPDNENKALIGSNPNPAP